MKYEEFLNICKEVAKDFRGQGYLDLEYYPKNHYWGDREVKKISDNPRLKVSWSTGGKSGGSCWGGEPEGYVSDNPPEDLQILDKILEKVCPDINFLRYKNLYNELVEHDTYTEYEYYGNETDYAIKTLYLKKLYQYLIDNKMISDE